MADDTPSVLSLSNGPLSFSERVGSWRRYDAGGLDMYGPAEQGVGRAAEKLEEVAKRVEADRPKAAAERKSAAAGVETAMDRPRPSIPQTERVPSPPKPEDYQKMSMAYLGAMVLLGAFGGKFIRGGGNAALSAFNGALQGWQQGNLEAYENASKEWKQKQQQVLDNNQAKLDEYRMILEDRNLSIQDQMDRYKLAAAKYQDKLSYDRAAAGDWTGVGQLYDKQARIQDRARKATQDLDGQRTQQDAQAVETANQWKQYLATPQGQQELAQMPPGDRFRLEKFIERNTAQPAAPGSEVTGAATPTATPPGRPRRDFTADGWTPQALRDAAVNYNLTRQMPTGLGRGHGLKIQGEIRDIAAELNQQEGKTVEDRINDAMKRKAHQAGLTRYLSGDRQKTLTALNTVVSHLNVLRDLGDAMNNGDQPRLNQIYQWISTNIKGAEQPTDFAVAAHIVGAEVMNALVTTGGGVGERQEMGAAWQQFGSPQMIHGAIETASRLMAGRLRAQRQGFQAGTGLAASEFDGMLLPEVKTYFDEVEQRHPGGGGGGGAGAGRADPLGIR